MKNNFLRATTAWLFLLSLVTANAQAQSQKNLHFVYIDHEVTTPVTELSKRLQMLHEDAEEVGDALIIYLSDGKSSIVSFTNLKDLYGKERDSEHAFVEIIAALQDANQHDVVAREDVKNILTLFEEYNFMDDKGNITYSSVTMDFYIGTSFWALGNNERVISHLFHDFSMGLLPKSKFNINVYKPQSETLSYKEGQLFGDNNVDKINNMVQIFNY